MREILSVQDLIFQFEEKKIFINAKLTLNDQEKAGLWGPNGSGKTTFFRLLTGLLKPTSGSVIFDGKKIQSKEDLQWLRRKLGYVLQYADDQLFFPEVIEDVAFGPLNIGLSREEAREVVMESLRMVGMTDYADALSFKLSGGQKKLVALASVLSMKPEMILFDEPTAGLDEPAIDRFIEIVNKLSIPTIIISHDPLVLEKTCSSFYTIVNGKFERLKEGAVHTHRHVHPFGNIPHSHEVI